MAICDWIFTFWIPELIWVKVVHHLQAMSRNGIVSPSLSLVSEKRSKLTECCEIDTPNWVYLSWNFDQAWKKMLLFYHQNLCKLITFLSLEGTTGEVMTEAQCSWPYYHFTFLSMWDWERQVGASQNHKWVGEDETDSVDLLQNRAAEVYI